MKKKVAIIGSGIAGLSLSIRLSKMGYDVYVYEKNSCPGGKLSSFKLGKFRFDIGPPLLTMPNYIDELFELFGEDPRKYFNYKKKEIGCKYFWEDGIKLNAYSCDGNGKIVTKKFSKEAEVATRHNNGGEQGRLIDKWHNEPLEPCDT